MAIVEKMINIPSENLQEVFGAFDNYVKIIEKNLGVTVIERGNEVKIIGDEQSTDKAKRVINELVNLSAKGSPITEQNVNYCLSLVYEDNEHIINEIDKDLICFTIQGKPIKPKTLGQKNYVDLIREKMIVFGMGPAGTGKTYLAMACAITAFKNNDVNRIILTHCADFTALEMMKELIRMNISATPK